ncbi:MAG: efflux RND transporter permease subunit [Alphaproteobacteria bacterium]|nr:efflux RND transporter permease subunit [Alphaproteobacteria bacterium]
MNLTEFAVKNRAVSYFVSAVILAGGIGGYFTMGHLEDPIFSVKKAIIITPYPGASPEEVELEVTDRIEKAIQEVPELRHSNSHSYPGLSVIKIDTHQRYWRDKLPQVWDDIRKKIRDRLPEFPPGVGKVDISDDFNFVYGFVLAVTGDGFTYKQLEDYADDLKKELSLVEGVARAELWGVQEKVIYLDIREQQLAALGLTTENFVRTLQIQNKVVDSGFLEVGQERMRIAPTGKFLNPQEIGELYLRAYAPEVAGQNQPVVGPYAANPTGPTAARPTPTGPASGGGFRSELIPIKDIATVRPGYKEPQDDMMRFGAKPDRSTKPSIAIQIAAIDGANIVDVGENLDKRLIELKELYPVGIEIGKVAWQSTLVTASIGAFMGNLIGSVLIVLGVLTLAMGLRMGVVIGTGMVLTIAMTFVGMAIMEMNLQRMSLGALIIAMGMMVDNSIVVAESAQVKIDSGMERVKAAIQAAVQPTMSLLGATVIASATFYPVYASDTDAGEYCRALFIVVALSLFASWLIAITLTPMQCIDLLKEPKPGKAEAGEGRLSRLFRGSLVACLRLRWPVLIALGGALGAAFVGFGEVKQMFFPDASRPQLMVDFWYPNGTRIEHVAEDIRRAEEYLLQADEVENISTYVGGGPPRFYLPVDPERPFTPHYAEIVVNTNSYEEIFPLVGRLEPWMAENYPGAVTRVRFYGVGPSETWKLEWHVTGPAVTDLDVLRDITDQMVAILRDTPIAKEVRTNLSNKVKRVVPVYAQERGRWSAITREDLARATRRAYDGQQVGLYREEDDLYPIILRHTEEERVRAAEMNTLQVHGTLMANTVPLSQVTKEIQLDWEEPANTRFDRRRAITLQAEPKGTTYPVLKAAVLDKIRAIPMPPGYEIYLDGEDESTLDAVLSLLPGIVPASAVVMLTLVLLYNAYRPVIIILLTVPFVFIGITPALLVADAPFGFVAILGAMSLSGMMIKNIIVLLDEINLNLEKGMTPYESVIEAVMARARPVVLAAATTVGGVATIAGDVFWSAMAITIIGGLTVGTFLTLFLVPTLYAVCYKIYPETPARVQAQPAPASA